MLIGVNLILRTNVSRLSSLIPKKAFLTSPIQAPHTNLVEPHRIPSQPLDPILLVLRTRRMESLHQLRPVVVAVHLVGCALVVWVMHVTRASGQPPPVQVIVVELSRARFRSFERRLKEETMTTPSWPTWPTSLRGRPLRRERASGMVVDHRCNSPGGSYAAVLLTTLVLVYETWDGRLLAVSSSRVVRTGARLLQVGCDAFPDPVCWTSCSCGFLCYIVCRLDLFNQELLCI